MRDVSDAGAYHGASAKTPLLLLWGLADAAAISECGQVTWHMAPPWLRSLCVVPAPERPLLGCCGPRASHLQPHATLLKVGRARWEALMPRGACVCCLMNVLSEKVAHCFIYLCVLSLLKYLFFFVPIKCLARGCWGLVGSTSATDAVSWGRSQMIAGIG